MPTSDKVPLQNRYRKIWKIFCNDFRFKFLICRSLTFKCLLVTQLLIIHLQREVIIPPHCNGAKFKKDMSKSTFKILLLSWWS